jgi:outer membrane protein TolC
VPAEVFARRPDLIAAEADVRAAFSIEHAARLDLLPSLSLAAGAEGGADSPSRGFRTWMVTAGPRLDIPVWDPARIAAVPRGRAEAAAAAAAYRAAALDAVEEIEGGHVNLRSHLTQWRSAEDEVAMRRRAWSDAQSMFGSGLISSIEATEFRHSYYEARRVALRLKLRALNDHLLLVRALGG